MEKYKLIYTFLLLATFFIFMRFAFDISNTFLVFLIISSLLIWFLTNIKSIFWYIFAFLIIIINIVLVFFAIIPTYDKEVNVLWFYSQQKNFINIVINDEEEVIKENNARIRIIWPWWINETINFTEENLWINFEIKENYVITFQSRTNNINSSVIINLWDWTIIRLLPQTTIRINQILQNHNNLLDSKTNISIENWNIWFSVIRTIIWDDSFNIKTENWTLVIRWTSWFISHNQNNKETSILSYNHIIELIDNNWNSHILWKNDIIKIKDNIINKMDINQFINMISQETYININRFFQDDLVYIENYKNSIVKYVIDNYWWTLDNSERLWKISKIKLNILSIWNNDYKNKLENYKKYEAILWNYEIKSFNEKLIDWIIIPINKNFNDIKLNFLENLSKENIEAAKSYIINRYNKVLDLDWNIDISLIEWYLKWNINIDRIRNNINNLRY